MFGGNLSFFATEIDKNPNITADVDDAIADIALVFHWPPQICYEMNLSELMGWRERAVQRYMLDKD